MGGGFWGRVKEVIGEGYLGKSVVERCEEERESELRLVGIL